jgi:hypothetical protein
MTRRREFTHTIALGAEPDRVFPMFTPLGEIPWIPGWTPTFVFPADGHVTEGLVWTTGSGDASTLWTCVDWHPEARRVRYVRVVPKSMMVLLSVACRLAGPARTDITVSHLMTALTPAGESELAAMTPETYAQMIEGWRAMAKTWLDAHPHETVAA